MGDDATDPNLLAFASNVTPTLHRTTYPAISPSRPELSQVGNTILITGGSAGIGLATAKSFITASASTIVITGRRPEILSNAIASLTEAAKTSGKGTRIIGKQSDGSNPDAINTLWDELAKDGVVVDVLVLNIAKFATPKPLLELGIDHVWESFNVNVRAPLHFAERFSQQGAGRPKTILNLSTNAVHMYNYLPFLRGRPEYSLSKGSGTLALQYIAADVSPDEIQIISYHPGVIYTEAWSGQGATEDMFPFDDITMPADFAVWAASKEARFLHGRFVWAAWDVEELAKGEVRKRIDNEVDFLTMNIWGLKGANV
ncbi:hypothetical protein OQA88_12669 [Cercophora sp. LCS_1]